MTEARRPSRRGVIFAGLGLAGTYAGLRYAMPALSERLRGLALEPLDTPAGFRRLLSGGTVSRATFDPFVGLAVDPVANPITSVDLADAQLCDTLFKGWSGDPAVVPIAYFTDYNCPYCRVLSTRLLALEVDRPGDVHLIWHELPLLGDTSVLAARAALAASVQGAYAEFHKALMTSPLQATLTGVAGLASDLGLDVERLERDMTSAAVTTELAETQALSDAFGFIGTPSLLVGRTVVVGVISDTTLARLIERERADGPIRRCY